MTKYLSPDDFYRFLDEDVASNTWSFELTADDVKKYCSHKWIEMGFIRSKLVCKWCDLDKEKWDEFISKESK